MAKASLVSTVVSVPSSLYVFEDIEPVQQLKVSR